MEKLPKFLKNIAKIAAVSAIGLMPNQLKGQDTLRNNGKELNIENKIELNSQIFDEIEKGYKNGVLKNTPENVYFFHFEKDGYNITYDLDANYDKNKDENPTITIDYVNGKLNYLLKKGNKNIDIVYNYEDDSLSNSETKSYGDFAVENIIIINKLYGKNNEPVNFRKINKSEKEKILVDTKKYFIGIDTVGINQNSINLKNGEEKINLKNQKIENEKVEEEEILNIAKKLLDYFNGPNDLEGKVNDNDIDMMITLSHGIYSYKYDKNDVNVSFLDADGYKNEVLIAVNDNKIIRARKYKKTKEGNNIQYLSNQEIKKILEDAYSEIN
jgi:hypothetical protein